MWRTFAVALGLFLLVAASAPEVPRFSASGIDDAMDLHGDPAGADLILFVGGNQWFVMPQLIEAFKAEHPEIHAVFYETLPPGILAMQIARGSLAIDELRLNAHADVYLSVPALTSALAARGLVEAPVTYASNDLGIMVRAHNPRGVHSMRDLGRSDIRVAMPNPTTEGIARQIEMAYRLAGGTALEDQIMNRKVSAGTTRLTAIHHRQTPIWILNGTADAGPVWYTEALYQQRIRSGIEAIAIPASQNVRANYVASIVAGAPHPAAAEAFIQFLVSRRGQAIFRSFGFDPAT
jgi:molybdate transport system substrate-binding protein